MQSTGSNLISKQLVKLNFDNATRKVMIDTSNYNSIVKSVSNIINLPIGSFSVSYIDDDKEVIAFPQSGLTQDEFDAFKAVQGPIRLVIQRVTPVANVEATPSLNANENAASSASSSAQTEEKVPSPKEEEKPKEPSLHVLIGSILANEDIVHDVQNLLASKPVSNIIMSLGSALVASGDDRINFGSLLEILLFQGPVILSLFEDLSEKHPELKEVFKFALANFGCCLKKKKLCRKIFKFCKKGGFGVGCKSDSESDDNEHHHKKCHEESKKCNKHESYQLVKPIHFGVRCDGCESDDKLMQESIKNGFHAPNHGGFLSGNRYKSLSVHDYDLCESCYDSEIFEHTHGPFLKIPKRVSRGCRWAGFIHPTGVEEYMKSQECEAKASASSSSSSETNSCHKRKNQNDGFESFQKQGMELFSNIMKAVSENSSDQQNEKEPNQSISSSSAATESKSEIDQDEIIAKKWKSKIDLLQNLGFVEWKKYIPILEEENGDLEKCIGRILALDDM